MVGSGVGGFFLRSSRATLHLQARVSAFASAQPPMGEVSARPAVAVENA